MKYLSEFFVPYDSFFETNILLTSMTFKLNSFFVLIKVTFNDLFIIKIYALSTHSYACQEKIQKKFFIVIDSVQSILIKITWCLL